MSETRIQSVKLTPVVVPARSGAVHSASIRTALHMLVAGGKAGWSVEFDELTKWIIEVRTAHGAIGLGESLRDVQPARLQAMAEGLIGLDPLELNLRELPLPYSREYDGFECAVYDLVGKLRDMPVYQLLGGAYRDRVYCSAWFGQREPDDAAERAAHFQTLGYDCLKFKGSLKEDPVAICRAITDRCGPDFRVIIDPNGRWERPAEVLPFLGALEEIGNVWLLEDPIPRWNLKGFRHLRQHGRIPIALHTAIPYMELFQKPQDVLAALEADAVDYFNFNGPLAWVQKLGDIAEVANVPFWHGSEVDLGLLEASYLHSAASSKMCTLPSDIFGRLIREHDLLATPLELDGQSHFRVPRGTGLGVELDREAVEKYRRGEVVEVG